MMKMNRDEHPYWLPGLLDFEFQQENEYSFEWKKYLLKKNSNEICQISNQRFEFYSPEIVKSVFDLCKMFNLPPEVRYLAVELLDRFLVHHFFDISETFQQMENQSLSNWRIITDRMVGQSVLRILTCIQLAVKYCWNCNMITAKTIQEVLEALGQTWQYSKKSILKSEARVYQNLQFNISNHTPLTYLEMFFEYFRQPGILQLRVSLDTFFVASIHVLDVAIVHHKQIYFGLSKQLGSNFKENLYENSSLSTIKGDFVSLAASVIFVASNLINSKPETSDFLLEILCTVGECRRYVVHMLGNELLDVVNEYLNKS